MEKKVVSGMMLILLLIGMLTLAFNIQLVKASITYYIRADGSVDPPTARIQRDGDIYTLTRDFWGMIVVERDNIVVDGAGFWMQGGIGPGIDLSYRNNVTVKGLTFWYFKYGIYLNYSSNNTLSGNTAFDCPYGIRLEHSNNNVLSGNNGFNEYGGDSGILLEYSSNNTLIGNTICEWYAYPPLGGVYGIRLEHSNNNVLSGNTVSDRDYGIVLYSSCNNVLSGNTVSIGELDDFDIYGIWLKYSNNNTLNDNAHYSHQLSCYAGIRLEHSNNNILSGNRAWGEWAGIELGSSCNNVLSGNRVSRHLVGIDLYRSSDNNVLSGNTASRNQYGISLGGSNNILIGNNMSTNDYGIRLTSDNTLFHNNFDNNWVQVYVGSGSVNTWDNGYPSGGNYWSDHVTVDDHSGIYQDEPGSDGIVDEPYVIDANNQDNYPFVNPWFLDTTPPAANAGPDQTVYEDIPVTFNGGASSDNVGIVNYVWTFTDVTPQTLTGITPTYTFTDPGVYLVTLNVSDSAGNYATDTITITVLISNPELLIQRMNQTIETWNLPKGTENSLTSKLEEALHLLDIGNENGAVHKLMDFTNQVEALRDKGKLENWQSDYLISEAQRIIDLING